MKCLVLLAVLALATLGALPAAATYYFEVPEATMEVWINPDASATIEYNLTFRNTASGEPIAVVDVGMPTADYDLSNMKAALDGRAQTDIRDSEYVHPGVEVHLSPAIPPTGEGKFTISFTLPDLVFQDTTKPENASFRITPTWFGSEYVRGTTNLVIAVYLPKEVNPDEVLYQLDVPFFKKGQTENKTVVFWRFLDTRLTEAHLVGLSFPKRVMERVVSMNFLKLAWRWWLGNEETRSVIAFLLVLATAIFFFRWTACTGCVIFVILGGALFGVFAVSPAFEALYPLILIPLWILMERSRRLRRKHYLPAIASAPGGGIKRGLTAAEAAVVLELPLAKVLTLVIFGLLKKGMLQQRTADPLTVALTPQALTAAKIEAPEPPPPPAPAPAPPAAPTWVAPPAPVGAPAEGPVLEEPHVPVLRSYEPAFLKAIAREIEKPVAEMDLDGPMKKLVTSTAKKMAGFDLEQTREYYRAIISKAWEEAQALGDLEKRTEFVDDNLEVLMLSPDYGSHFHTWHTSGYSYAPSWTRGAAPAAGGRGTTFGDVAASFAGWSENLAGRFAGTVDPVKMGLTPSSGIFAGVDRVSGDVLKAMASSSGGGGGGGGGGCACACAGCACACACAGGGR